MRCPSIGYASGLIVVAILTSACGDDGTGDAFGPGAGGAAASGAAGGAGALGGGGVGAQGTGGSGAFDPEHPGVTMFLSLGALTMMSQPMELAAAGFMPGAREDLESPTPVEEIPIDTCVAAEPPAPTPSCTGDEQCAPEQDCLPETDSDGQPVAGTDHCTTPRGTLDVGPLTLEGFASGPIELRYNAGQNGAYTPDGTGDGQLAAGTITFDQLYTFHGDGAAAFELGPLTGELTMPAALAITAPALSELPGLPGMMGLSVDPSQDLVLQWSGGSAGAVVRLNLAAAQGEGLPVNCRVSDDGEFTVPAAMLQAAQLGDMAFLNMLTIERVSPPGTASGQGLIHPDIEVVQTLILNVARQ